MSVFTIKRNMGKTLTNGSNVQKRRNLIEAAASQWCF